VKIEGTCGQKEVSSLVELHQLLLSRDGDFGEFWLGSKTFPALVIHTRGDLAYLHFFPSRRHPGLQAIGSGSGEDVAFKQKGHGDVSIPRAFVVSIEKAYQAAAEFFTNLELPNCVQWKEL
jgi:hypothetical protein